MTLSTVTAPFLGDNEKALPVGHIYLDTFDTLAYHESRG